MERELTVTSLSPLVIRADRGRVQFNPTLDYIPGSAVRGALAAVYLQDVGDDEVFRRLIAGGGASFGDLTPSTKSAAGHLLPATAVACKYFQAKHAASLTDSLLRLAYASAMDDPAPLQGEWEKCPAPGCDRKRDRAAASYFTAASEAVTVHRRVLAGTAIRRTTGTVAIGQLYSQEALEEGQEFRGVVRVNPADEALWAPLELALPVGAQFGIGAAKSRGMGLVEIAAWGEPEEAEPLERRLDEFERTRRVLWGEPRGGVDEVCFSLTFASHALLRDRPGVGVASLAERDDLAQLLSLPGARLGRHVVIPATVKGWDARKGLPKPDEAAIGRGSVLLFHVTSDGLKALIPWFRTIEAEGIGRRREEGLGRVRVCAPFHYRFLRAELGDRQ